MISQQQCVTGIGHEAVLNASAAFTGGNITECALEYTHNFRIHSDFIYKVFQFQPFCGAINPLKEK